MYDPVLVEVFEEALLPTWARRLPSVLEMIVTTKDTQNHDGQNRKTEKRTHTRKVRQAVASCTFPVSVDPQASKITFDGVMGRERVRQCGHCLRVPDITISSNLPLGSRQSR